MAEKILIVDDDADTLRLVGLMLQRQGYEVLLASDGSQALKKAEEEDPDLILLDVMMPGMDGYEVARHLRASPTTASTPILMFTAKSQIDDKLVGFEAGADDYLTKPTHPAELQAHVRALLARSARERRQKSPAAAAVTLGVLAARGGLGVTTLAVNLGMALYTPNTSEVIVAEMVPGRGTLGLDLGIADRSGLARLLAMSPQEITRQVVAEALVRDPSGLQLLLASEKPSDMQLTVNVEQYQVIVSRLASLASFVILDLGNGLPPFVRRLLPLCRDLIIVTEPYPNTVVHTRALLEDLKSMGVKETNLKIVLNSRVRSETILPALEVQNRLGQPLAAVITPAPELFQSAMRMHKVGIAIQPDGLTSRQIEKLASLFRPTPPK